MIGFLRGKVCALFKDEILLDCNNIGFRVKFGRIEDLKLQEEVTVYTYQNVREDEISLFGFLSLAEYELFIKLISVKGLGPRIASNILARVRVEELVRAIETGDFAFMKALPGVGNKTAAQIILDLKGKLVAEESADDPQAAEVTEALKALGFKVNEISPVLKKMDLTKLKTGEAVRKALNILAGRK